MVFENIILNSVQMCANYCIVNFKYHNSLFFYSVSLYQQLEILKWRDWSSVIISKITALQKHSHYLQRQIAVIFIHTSSITINRIKSKLEGARGVDILGANVSLNLEMNEISVSLAFIVDGSAQKIVKNHKSSIRITWHRIVELGFECLRTTKKLKLTSDMKLNRLSWTEQYRHITSGE